MNARSRRALLGLVAVVGSAAVGCGHLPHAAREGGATGKVKPSEAADVQVALGRSLESEKNSAGAITAYEQAIRLDPNRADAHVRLAMTLDRQGQFAEAAPHYEKALKLRPGDAEIFCDRGYSLALQGKAKEAEAVLRQAIAKDPKLARAHNNLGLLLGRTGRADEALSEFRKGGCPEADAHLNLAFALGQDRKWSEAHNHVELARTLGANTADVVAAADDMTKMMVKAEMSPSLAGEVDPAVRTASSREPLSK